MTVNNLGPAVSEQCFQERLDRLRASNPNHNDLVQELGTSVRKAPDDQIVPINPIQYAVDHGRDEAQVVDLFLHARKAGLLTMEWHYVCRGCGTIIESFHTLNSAGEHSFCKRVAVLFTDIKGSTALYDRIGDMKAFNLVRQHFGVLRDVIASNHGALVKTIGDAVMASFHEPIDAIRAALEMLAQIRRFNDSAGEELITLKIGAHVGPCLAVTLNERLDYFGRTVNLAARVQGLAAENEIYLSDEIYRLPGAADLLAAMQCDAQTVRVKGIEREMAVHVLRAQH